MEETNEKELKKVADEKKTKASTAKKTTRTEQTAKKAVTQKKTSATKKATTAAKKATTVKKTTAKKEEPIKTVKSTKVAKENVADEKVEQIKEVKQEVPKQKVTVVNIKEKKKKNNTMLKAILIVLLIILALFVIKAARNYGIINTHVKAIAEYRKITNMYQKINTYQGDSVSILENYKKDEKALAVGKYPSGKMVSYKDKVTNIMLMENASGNKIVNLNVQTEPYMSINTIGEISLEEMNSPHIGYSIAAIIKWISTEECNGKQCYVIDLRDGVKYWIDKDTYLIVRMTNGLTDGDTGEKITMVTDYTYSFNTLTDEKVQKPSITGYKVIN